MIEASHMETTFSLVIRLEQLYSEDQLNFEQINRLRCRWEKNGEGLLRRLKNWAQGKGSVTWKGSYPQASGNVLDINIQSVAFSNDVH